NSADKMHWPGSKKAPEAESPPPAAVPPPASEAPAAPVTRKFSAPPPSTPSSQAPVRSYDSMDFSKYSNKVYESDGLSDEMYAKRERSR
ncbi:unnamed protein product, partial [Polarella glacialis]